MVPFFKLEKFNLFQLALLGWGLISLSACTPNVKRFTFPAKVNSSEETVSSTAPVLASATVTNSNPTNNANFHLSYGELTGAYNRYCIQENSSVVSTCTWILGVLPTSYQISSIIEGEVTLSIWLKNYQGEVSLRVDTNTVVMDQTGPMMPLPFLQVVALFGFTASTTVNLNYASTDSYAEYCIQENNTDVDSCVWNVGTAPSTFSLSSVENTKVLSVWLKDAAGNISLRGDSNSFILDLTAPVLISANVSNSNPTNAGNYLITYGSVLGTYSHYCIQENNTNVGSCFWTEADLPHSYRVTNTQGDKILSVWLKDRAGNVSSRIDTNAVALDSIAPVLTTATVTNSNPTNSPEFNLIIPVTEMPWEYCIQTTTNQGTCSWIQGPLPSKFTITSGDGAYILSIWGRDRAGNVSNRVDTNSITLDTTAPVLASATIVNPSPSTTRSYTLIYGSITGSYSHYCILENTDQTSSCDWVAGTLPTTFRVHFTENAKTLYVYLKDSVGNVSNKVFTNSVTYQFVAPSGAQVAAGLSHSCSIINGGIVKCWGSNQMGQLGNGSVATESLTPVTALGISNAVAISAGENHTCALMSNGNMSCWGSGTSGQLGTGDFVSKNIPADVSGVVKAMDIATGGNHTCAVLIDGTVKCWGAAGAGQISDGATVNQSTAISVIAIRDAISISAGYEHTCVVNNSGNVQCWGSGTSGQLGNGSQTSSAQPVTVHSLSNASKIAAGGYQTCVVMTDRTVKCWGSNQYGQLGNNTNSDSNIPVSVQGLSDAKYLSVGREHACVVLVGSATAKCWGRGSLGRLGNSGISNQSVPVTVTGLTNVGSIAAGGQHSCAQVNGSVVQCWGAGDVGQIGNGSTSAWTYPVWVSGEWGALAISTGNSHSCAIFTNNQVKCWGAGHAGQLGNGGFLDSTAIVNVSSLSNVVKISSGGNHNCVVLSDGKLKCWGANHNGELGIGNTTNSATPVLVMEGATGVSANNYHTCAVLNDESVKCWGMNGSGQLGNGSILSSTSPVTVSGITSAIAITTSYSSSCALLSDGTVKCWGDNSYGQLGNGSNSSSLTPVLVSGLSDVIEISGGYYHSCARRMNDEVVCWGYNVNGELGIGNTMNSLIPVTVSGLTGIKSIATGYFHSCAVDRNGYLKCWGAGWSGQIGYGGTHNQLSPVSIYLSTNNVVSIDGGNNHTCATLIDGTAKCWGSGSHGQLGNGFSSSSSSSPTSVLGLGFWQ